MIERKIAAEIMENIHYFPVIGIIGPRQVGKTTLAKELQHQLPKPSIYLDLELEEDLIRLQNAQSYLQMTCIEVKYSATPAIAKGFYQSVADLKPKHQYVIVPSGTPYFLNDHLKVVNLLDFLTVELIGIL